MYVNMKYRVFHRLFLLTAKILQRHNDKWTIVFFTQVVQKISPHVV